MKLKVVIDKQNWTEINQKISQQVQPKFSRWFRKGRFKTYDQRNKFRDF